MKIKLPFYVKEILNTLNEHGYAAYVVGGAVRDSLMGLEPKDWDVTTDATPDEIESIFKNTIPTGKQYGTITVCIYGETEEYLVEVTTFREDIYIPDGLDYRRPSAVKFGTNIKEDLARRDLTINAMSYNELVGLVDPFNGEEDIKNKVIRFVGNTNKRIKEDALRILRAIRFAVKLDFTLDDETIKTLNNFQTLLTYLSRERIHDEITRILSYTKNNHNHYHLINFLEPIFSRIFEHKICDLNPKESIYHEWLEPILIEADYRFKLALLLADKELYEIEQWLRDYKFSRDDIKTIINLVKIYHKTINNISYINDMFIRQLMREYGKDNVTIFFNYYADSKFLDYAIRNLSSPTSVSDLEINGTDVAREGFEGEQIGEALSYLLDYVITDPENNNREQLYAVLEHFKEL